MRQLPGEFSYEYTGNLHIHSQYSDGVGTVPEIVQSAQRVGLDFIVLNDHSYMIDDLHLDEEGYYGDVLVLMGQEIGRRYHHYLAFDLQKILKDESIGPQEVIDRVNAQGGFGFMAHPFEKGMPFSEKSIAYTWNDLSVNGFSGICIWNFSSRWKERVKTFFHGLFFLLFRSQTLKGPSRKTLLFWDGLCRQRRVAAMGGSDAHASMFKWGALRLRPFSYDYLLNTINIHILLNNELQKESNGAKTSVLNALKNGRLFIAHERLGSARGFRFYYIKENGTYVNMGEERRFQPGTIYVEAPESCDIRLVRDGTVWRRFSGQKASCRIEEKGVYRVEAYRHLLFFGLRPWIFSNPIYLR